MDWELTDYVYLMITNTDKKHWAWWVFKKKKKNFVQNVFAYNVKKTITSLRNVNFCTLHTHKFFTWSLQKSWKEQWKKEKIQKKSSL